MLDHRSPRLTLLAILAVSLGACSDLSAPGSTLHPVAASQSGGGGGNGGGGTGGTGGNNGGRVVLGAAPTDLPTTAPAPDVIYRESFGSGNGMRPTGGKGAQHQAFGGAALTGFWVEYPGSKNTAWLSGDVGQSWNFAGASDNPFEMPSPLQSPNNGAVVSSWNEPPTTYPTALLPVTLPAAGYELSMEGYPAPISNAYVAIGFTNSAALNSNLTTSGAIWLRVRDLSQFGVPLSYELRSGSLATGKVLASGEAGAAGFNRMSIRVSPAAGTVTLSVNGTVIGTYNAVVPTPKYAAFEGIGVLDDFVIRQ